jgi:hypothetical protein
VLIVEAFSLWRGNIVRILGRSLLYSRSLQLNADVVEVVHGPHGPCAIFLGVVIVETASTSYLCE